MSGLLAYLAARAIPETEEVSATAYRRVTRIGDRIGILTVDFSRADRLGKISADYDGEDPRKFGLDGAIMALADADAPVAAISQSLGVDPQLARLARRWPGLRIPGTVDPFELTVRAILGQQVSVAAARTLARRVVTRWGPALKQPQKDLAHGFPSPERLLRVPLEEIGIPSSRANAIRAIADAMITGHLDLRREVDPGRSAKDLLAVRGIGSWTAGYVALRALGDRDAIPTDDLGLRQAIDVEAAVPASSRQVAERAEKWRPWRGYGAIHLWTTFLAQNLDRQLPLP